MRHVNVRSVISMCSSLDVGSLIEISNYYENSTIIIIYLSINILEIVQLLFSLQMSNITYRNKTKRVYTCDHHNMMRRTSF